jgi:hypothetical protein
MLALVATVGGGASGCFPTTAPSGGACTVDGDCPDGQECTRVEECVESGTSLRVVLSWTVAGVAPTPEAPEPCAPFSELEVRFHDPNVDDEDVSFRPVPCDLGRTVYDKMPPRLTSVEVIAYDEQGRDVDSESASLQPSGESDVTVDLQP